MPGTWQSLGPVDIRRRLSGTRAPENPLAVDMADIGTRVSAGVVRELSRNLRAAGVLIPIIERQNELTVLLTERSAGLRHHAGQVSFPGGGMESQDVDIAATALRETFEEVGIEPHEVEIAGYLDPMPTVTGFAVTPVVGFVRESFTLCVDPVEVEMAFEVPLDFLMDARNEEHTQREYQGVTVPVVTFHYEGHRIWGATASMLGVLRKVLINQ